MKIDYINHMGDDLLVVNAARVSFDKESYWENEEWRHPDFEEPNYLSDKDARLISYLAKHGHWTPFSHPQITLRETVPIFVARQRFKHTVGFTYNEVSRRYVDDEPTFYYPTSWRKRPSKSVKQGSGDDFDRSQQFILNGNYDAYIKAAEQMYKDLVLYAGVAPEQARMVLPQSMYTSYYVTGSLAAFARAYKQRSDSHAQQEIQELAKQWGEIIEPLFPCAWKALTEN